MFTDLDMTNDATLDYEHTGLTAGTTYHYQVAAINDIGTGASATASATTPAVVPACACELNGYSREHHADRPCLDSACEQRRLGYYGL